MTTERDHRLRERQEADGRYNDALTAVDEALPRPREHGGAAPDPDVDLGAAALRGRTCILPDVPPDGRGWRGRLAAFVWRIAGPVFTRQQRSNEAIADYAVRAETALRDLRRTIAEERAARRRDLDAALAFGSRLVQFLQQITPFVDTKLRVLEADLGEVRMAALSAQRTALAARRGLERVADGGAPAAEASAAGQERGGAVPQDAAGAAAYVGFEDLFRGSAEEIRARQVEYADLFAGASDVLDIGCGRGELLELLRERGIRARGIDLNPEMVEVCRARGLDAVRADALGYLLGLPDASLGGIVAAQVVEHLEPAYLVRLIEAAHAKLRPGSTIVLETINAACWVAFFESYIRDITHVRPLHPDTLKFLIVSAGFEDAGVHFRSPVDESGRLQRAAEDGLPPDVRPLAHIVNANMDRLNERLFTCLDYAVIAVRGR